MDFKTSRRLVLTILATVACVYLLSGQPQLSNDSVGTGARVNVHRLQFGLNALGAGIEYRYQVFQFVSADAVLSALRPGAAIGVTVWPVSFVFVQGVFGTGNWEEMPAPDGPAPFKPDYIYGWKAGLQIPIAPRKSTFFVQFGAGQLKYVQRHYLYNSAGLILEPPPARLYRRETRITEVFALSLGFCF
jgi:hypothetical protein